MKIKNNIRTVVILGVLLLFVILGFSGNYGVSNMDSLHLSDFNGTATPNFLVNQRGAGVIAVFQDAGTPIATWNNGGSFVSGGSIDLNGLSLILDVDGDTTITADTDDQVDFALEGNDQFILRAVAAADSAATTDNTEIAFTSPVDTTGTNIHNALTIDLAIGNATGGTNNVVGLRIDAITDDPQVVEKAIFIGDEWDYAIDTGLPIVSSAMYWFDDFIGDTVLAQYTEASGTDGQAVQAIVEEQFGVYQITSGDAGVNTAGDAEQLSLSLEWQADQGSLVFEIRLHLDTTIASTELCVGLTDNVALELPFTNASDTITAVASDAVAFCYDTNATTDEWWALGVDSTTKATGNAATGTAPTADTYQTLRIEVDDGGADCRFYIDGTLAGTLTANCVTPTIALAPVVVISSAQNTASVVVDVDYILVGAARD